MLDFPQPDPFVASPATNARGIRAVVFDYGGVFSASPFHRIAKVEEAMGMKPGTIVELMGYGIGVAEPADGDPYVNKWHQLECGDISVGEYNDWVSDRSEAVFGHRVEMRDFFGAGFGSMTIFWPMVHEAMRLKAAGYLIAVCTNNIAEFREHWTSQIPIGIFDDVVDSSEVRVRKPDPAIYELSCQRLGVRPDQAIFIDDHPGNVDGADNVGMHGVQVVDDDALGAIATVRALLAA